MAMGVQAPSRLGRYELLARLASGGMGEIFLARLEGAAGFEKLFVVKRILPHLADDARFRAMLIGEARIASRLSHANICQVYELGETDGQLYIVMEYLEGVTLLPLLRKASKEQTPLDFGFVAGVIQQVTDALHYAHELRDRSGESLDIVHRDVTPGNIFLTDAGVAKVLDFGIAKVKDASAHTQTGTIKGKYAYMAPEQLRGAQVDRRADVFALGVVIYEMLALRRLFQRKTDYLTFRAVIEQPIADLRRYRADVPDALAEAVARALDRDPANRFESARQLAVAFVEVLGTIKRPWTQGEIGDYVAANFAADIAKRGEQVAAVVHRTKPAGMGRTTMPLIVPDVPDAQVPDDADDDEFPAVESSVSDGQPPLGNPPAEPFAADSQAAAEPLRPPSPRRSLLWPVLAIAMAGIAGAALFLVWKQVQQQPPPVVNITSERAEPAPAPTPIPARVEPTRPLAKPAAKPKPPARRTSPYDDAIQIYRTQIERCAQDNGAPPNNARVVIVVTTTGKAKTISLEPPHLDASKLGSCIKSVLSGVKYPAAAAEMQVSVPLRAT